MLLVLFLLMFCFPVIQAVVEAGLVQPLVQLLQNAEFDIKKEAAWAISNATSGGAPEQIRYVMIVICDICLLYVWLFLFSCFLYSGEGSASFLVSCRHLFPW